MCHLTAIVKYRFDQEIYDTVSSTIQFDDDDEFQDYELLLDYSDLPNASLSVERLAKRAAIVNHDPVTR